jgi:glycosyltransferase involved in cell wall biosynthesis
MTKSLAISGHFRKNQMKGGVASFFQNLLRGIDAVAAEDSRFADLSVTVFHAPDRIPYASQRFEYRAVDSRLGRFGVDLKNGLFESAKFDVSFFPNYFRPPIVRSRRSVTVIHDLFYKNMPELIARTKRIWLDATQRYALRHCDSVVTISETVKQDVLRCFGTRWADKICPIWNPIAFERLDGVDVATVSQGRPYILGVALDRPHKNLVTLVRAYAKLRERRPDLCLVLVGELRSNHPSQSASAEASGRLPAAADVVRDMGLEEHVKVAGFVTDQELGALYRGAAAFVLPSLFEGFGMPAIEAMASGTPTLVSDLPVFREVTLGAARYLHEPQDPDAVCDSIDQVLAAGIQARPSQELIAEVRRVFAPATIARQYLDVLFPKVG